MGPSPLEIINVDSLMYFILDFILCIEKCFFLNKKKSL